MSAPNAFRVSIRTPVWMVMCKGAPAMRAPLSGLAGAAGSAQGRHQAGHLDLGDGEFLAAPIGQADVFDDIVVEFRQ